MIALRTIDSNCRFVAALMISVFWNKRLVSQRLMRQTRDHSCKWLTMSDGISKQELSNMNEQKSEFGRRRFLKTGLLAAGTAALAPALPLAAARDNQESGSSQGIPTRKFGKTGHTLPILGMGGSAMVQLWTKAYGVNLLSMDERIAMVRHAYDHGIRYFDTARVYGESESIVGKGLKGVRDNAFVATKVAVLKPEQVRKSVETSLQQLGMDHVDTIQIHSPAIEAVGFEGAMKLHAEVVKLRDQKMCRFIGLTTHVAFETVYRMISTGGFDQVLLAYGYFRKGMDTLLSHRNLEHREMCLAKAHELGMAIVAMKVMGANILGHNAKNLVPDYEKAALDKLPGAAIRWTLQDDRVSVLNIGVSMPQDVDKNIAILKGELKFTNDDRTLLAHFAGRAYESSVVKAMKTV
jgi:predicted aldo/keto reductase-like oxidoreductase